MATELKPPYVIPCTATELDEAIENSHTHPNKTDLDAIGTAALRDVGTDVGQVPVVGEDGKIDPSLTPETYVHPATHPVGMITGLGTAATKDAGTAAGNVPIIGSNGKLPGTIVPADNNKVDKVEGKDLSTNDYTTAEKAKLAGIATGANNYVHPSTHPSTMITGLGTAATKNTGTVSGSIPLIGSDGLLPTSVLPPPLTVENVLTSTSTVNALSAAQGKMLNDAKVDKVSGKGLSTNDYSTAEKNKLAGIATGANNYTHPATHPASMITGLGTAAAKDTGTSAGNVPVLGSDGKLADEVLPEIPSPTLVYNGLDSESTTDALSAAQGKILADQIDGLTASDITYEGTDLNSALLTLDSRVLAAQTDAQGALAGITSLQTTIGDIGTILDDINGEVV